MEWDGAMNRQWDEEGAKSQPPPPSTCSWKAVEGQMYAVETRLSPVDMSLHDSELVTPS